MISEGFSYSYSKTMASLGSKLEEYWNEINHERKQKNPNCIPVEVAVLVCNQ